MYTVGLRSSKSNLPLRASEIMQYIVLVVCIVKILVENLLKDSLRYHI